MSGNEERTRNSLTSINKWTYVPGKVFTLTPINLQDIKNQLLGTSNEESDSSEDENAEEYDTLFDIFREPLNAGNPEKDTHFEEKDICLEEKDTFLKEKDTFLKEKDTFEKENTFHEEIPTEAIHHREYSKQDNNFQSPKDHIERLHHKHSSFSTSLGTVPEDSLIGYHSNYSSDVTMVCENKENIEPIIEPLNLSRDKKKNDSFDLDFSTLSLHTPEKRVEKNFNYVTPKINIIPPSEVKSTVPLFKTPNVTKRQYLNMPLFKTPVNTLVHPVVSSIKKHNGTPYLTAKKPVLADHNLTATEGSDGQITKPVIYTALDGSSRMLVNDVEYTVMSTLGRGGSSEVFCCFDAEKKLHVAIKLVTLSDPTTAEGYINEVKLLESLQTCDKIITMYDYEIRDERLIVVLEKGGEDLSTVLKQIATRQSRLPNYMLLFYWMEMLYAVKQIHTNGVIHSDLKPANFLRTEEGLKLIDFGIASKVQEDMTCVYKVNQEGSCNYISPEALSQHSNENVNSPTYGKPKYKIHFKSDVWSLGCILYQLVYKKTPFQHINQIWAKLAAITDQNYKICYPKADWVPSRIVTTIRRCLQHDVKSRPSVDELIDEYEQLLKANLK